MGYTENCIRLFVNIFKGGENEFVLWIIKQKKLSVIGLGYVGLPLANEFSKHIDVIGFDINENKINKYIQGYDITGEVGDEELKQSNIEFTYNEDRLKWM